MQNSRDKLDSWGESLRGIGTKLTAGVTTPLLAAGGVMVNWASDLEQAMGKSEAVFGDQAGAVQEWSKSTAKAYGFAQSESLAMASTYGSLFKVMGMSNEVASDYSMELIGLSADMAAFNDVSNSRASEALMAGLSGEYMSLRSMGVFLNEAAVSQEALTIAQAAGREEITEADKVQARYNLIMEQTAQQQGQAARESGNWASRLAQVRARVKDTGAAIGARLMPFALKLLDAVEGLVSKFDKLSPSMQKWAIVIAAVAAALGPLLLAIGFLLPGLSVMLGVVGALLSPIGLLAAAIGLLAFAFRDELISAVQAAVEWFTDFVGGSDQVLAMVRNLREAFQAFKDGDFGEAFAAIGRAAGNLWATIREAIAMIDWGSLGRMLLDGLASLATYVAGFVLDVGAIAVRIAGWLWNQVVDLWEGLKSWAVGLVPEGQPVNVGTIAVAIAKWAFNAVTGLWDALTSWAVGGTYGDGTGGPTAGKVGQIPLGTVMANIAAWVFNAVTGIATALKDWIGPVTVSGVAWSIWLFVKDLTISIFGDPGEPVRAKIGEIVVKGVAWAVELLSDVEITNILKLGAYIAAAIVAAGIVVPAVSAAAPFIVTLGLVFGFAALGLLLYKAVSDWALSNPLDALEVFITIALGLKEILDDLPSLSDLREHVLSAIGLPEDGIIRVSIGVVIDFISGDGEEFPEQDPDVPYKDPFPNMSNFGNVGGIGSRNLLGGGAAGAAGSSAFSGLVASIQSAMSQMQAAAADGMASVNAAFTSGFTQVQTTVSGAMASTTSAMTAGVTILQTTTAGAMSSITSAFRSGYTMVQTTVAGAMSSVTSAMTSGMTQLQTTTAGAMSSVTSAVRSGFTQVQTTVAGAMSSVTSAMRSGMTQVQTTVSGAMSSITSATRSAFTQMQTAVAGSLSSIVSAVRSAFGQIPGIIASVGGSAASTAYSVGANIGNAMASGMRSALGAISAAANAMVAEADRAVRARARISSPSRLFMQMGEYVGEGFELGIRSMIPDAKRAAADLVGLPGLGALPQPAYGTPGELNAPVVQHHYHETKAYTLTATEMERLLRELDDLPAHTIEIIRAGKRNVAGSRR